MASVTLTGREWLQTPEGQKRMIQMMEPLRRDAERMQESMQRLVEPTLKFHERMQEISAPLLKIAEAIEPLATRLSRLHESFHLTFPPDTFPTFLYEPVQEHVLPIRHESVAPTVVATAPIDSDITYDAKRATLSKTVVGARRVYAFEAKDRRRLFVRLVSARSPVSTEELRLEFGRKTTDAIRKIVQGINEEVKKKLGIRERIIVGRRGSGYELNPDLFIHRL